MTKQEIIVAITPIFTAVNKAAQADVRRRGPAPLIDDAVIDSLHAIGQTIGAEYTIGRMLQGMATTGPSHVVKGASIHEVLSTLQTVGGYMRSKSESVCPQD